MSTNCLIKRLAKGISAVSTIFVLLLSAQAPVLAQCIMCKTSLDGSAEGAKAAFRINLGIILLLIPAAALFTGIFCLVYRYRNSYVSEEVEHEERFLSTIRSGD